MPKPAGKPVARRRDYRIEAIPFAPDVRTPRAQQARELLAQQHYAGGGANTAVLLAGLVRRDTDALVGVAQFLPTTPPAARYVAERCAKTEPREVLALSRLVVDRGEPQNAASILVGAALRQLRRRRDRWGAVVSYADEAEGHVGTVYQASNWVACGYAAPRVRWCDPRQITAQGRPKLVSRKATKDRTVAEMERLGYQRCGSSRKRRFIYPLRGSCACEA